MTESAVESDVVPERRSSSSSLYADVPATKSDALYATPSAGRGDGTL